MRENNKEVKNRHVRSAGHKQVLESQTSGGDAARASWLKPDKATPRSDSSNTLTAERESNSELSDTAPTIPLTIER